MIECVESGDVNTRKGNGWTPLIIAALTVQEVLRLLLDNGADVDLATIKGPLSYVRYVSL